MEFKVLHNTAEKQFYADIEGKIAKLDYSVAANGKTLDYWSTFVPPELRGQQIGEKIVKFALDYAKNNHLKIIPSCPFVQRIVDQHPEYKKLIAK